MASQRSRGQPLITPRLCRSRYQISMVARRSITEKEIKKIQAKQTSMMFGFDDVVQAVNDLIMCGLLRKTDKKKHLQGGTVKSLHHVQKI